MPIARFMPFVLLSLLATFCLAANPVLRPDLRGTITDDSGKPVAGARVHIWTAAVKKGYSTLCPSCYPDCGKQATSNDKGEFEIKSLDPELRFELLTVKDGHAPTTTKRIDPAAANFTAITLPLRPLPNDPKHIIRGKIVDESGKPIPNAWAFVERILYSKEDGSKGASRGKIRGLDPLAIADDNGEFALVYTTYPIVNCDLHIGARGFASSSFLRVEPSSVPLSFTLKQGATVRGKLLKEGNPVPDAQMMLTQRDRSADSWFGPITVGTDTAGNFTFTNVPLLRGDAPSEWYLSATVESVRDRGALLPTPVTVLRDGQDLVVPDCQLIKGFTISGKILMPDGAPIPEGSRVFVSSSAPWDSVLMPLGPDGRFEFKGLFVDMWVLTASIKGYRHVGSTHGGMSPAQFRLNSDMLNLELKMELEPPNPHRK